MTPLSELSETAFGASVVRQRVWGRVQMFVNVRRCRHMLLACTVVVQDMPGTLVGKAVFGQTRCVRKPGTKSAPMSCWYHAHT